MTHHDDMPAALRMQLHALRRDIDPPPALWDGIAARLDAPMPRTAHARRQRWPLALAATLACAALAGWWALPPRATPADPALAAAVDGLERDARDLRVALAQDPDSTLVLQQLHRVDALRRTLELRATL